MPVFDVSFLLNVLLLLVLLFFQRRWLQRLFIEVWLTWQQHRPRRWKPQSPQPTKTPH